MDNLPVEILLEIFESLSQKDLVSLQTVSKRLSSVARANLFWRDFCYDKSPAVKIRSWTTFSQIASQIPDGANTANETAATFASMLQMVDAGTVPLRTGLNQTKTAAANRPRTKRLRDIANWDPSYASERVDWYSEYIARAGPLSVSWFQPASEEVKGLAHWQQGQEQRAIAPLEDGTICVWDANTGQEINRSPSGALNSSEHSFQSFSGATECVSVDSTVGRAFFAVGSQLKTVNLDTLQVLSSHEFTFPITALSQSRQTLSDVPLTVGTRASVHMFDPREHTVLPTPVTDIDSPPSPSLVAGDSYPISILNATANSIYLAGRYPSILAYDRRFFPRLEDTIYSGARLCSLGISHFEALPPSANLSPISTLLACGEYNGRGSLELYSLPYQKEDEASRVYKNRQSASRSKLLSVASHGTRIVFSDADGGLKWVERDGSSLVRSWNINQFRFNEPESHIRQANGRARTVLEFGAQGGDVVRKIIPLQTQETERGIRGDGDLLVWTGEKAGIIKFRSEEIWEDAKETVDTEMVGGDSRGTKSQREVRQMEDAMRRALMRHADEMNWMRRLGLS
ncbi:putative f-box domain protein [Phaeomoniella chlamydospora]|uniref:Putative f-box domain protein n=1 Tax=Phaeomoniella chlamydospora TaxID=158046 RepID=A0A0G2GGR2_PHACM|nr:putative f-box domain protein [Phaeomoniella chlamydospora]